MSDFDSSIQDIAIIGLTGRFPGAGDTEQFWRNLTGGVESISFFSDQELLSAGVAAELLSDPNYVKANGILEDIDLFDAAFFGYSPRETEVMDPQQRLFLECAWEALEIAGYNPEIYKGRIGVYAGVSMSSYLLNLQRASGIAEIAGMDQILLGNNKDFLSTRVSYKLNLRGPSITVQTACSTSLVAVHLACQSLLNGECDIAMAGGASINVPQKAGYIYQEGGKLSPDGHCRAFDAQSLGTVSGSGVGIVVLKRLEDAVNDGDYICAVIKGSAINNDGALKIGFTAPSVQGQANVIVEALAMAQVHPESIGYIEAHGTATHLGDPIEVTALAQAFRTKTHKKNFCAIGTVKSNIGHLDAAAGVAGLIKAVLTLQHGIIPPSLHFEQPNPAIDFANSPFYVNTQLSTWKPDRTPRRAGVSAFGIGGTNAHVILEETQIGTSSSPSRRWQLLRLSAKTISALETATTNLVAYLKAHPEANLADVAYTLQVGRKSFDNRRMIICSSHENAITAFEAQDPARLFSSVYAGTERQVAFMFPGGGAQYAGMGYELYRTEPRFRVHVDQCLQLLHPEISGQLKHLLYSEHEQFEQASRKLQAPSLALPALFITTYALAHLWMEWGIRPKALIGHSLGEYVAACLAGVLSLNEALALVSLRGRLFERLPQGEMLSIALSEQEIRPLLHSKLSLAAINGPTQCVVAGPAAQIEDLTKVLNDKNFHFRRLHIHVAAHSHMVDSILEEFGAFVRTIRLQAPKTPYISNVTGTWITSDQATDPEYWVQHLRQTVRFSDGLQTLLQSGTWILLEVGPGQALTTLVRQHIKKDTQHLALPSMRRASDQTSDIEVLLQATGHLWLAGLDVDWSAFYERERRQRVPLPTYPFDRQKYWIDPQVSSISEDHAALWQKRANIADWLYTPSWKQTTPPSIAPYEALTKDDGTWLVFLDSCNISARIAHQLRHQYNQNSITVSIGDAFERVDDSVYRINPQHDRDYDTLLADIFSQGKHVTRIIHAWCVNRSDDISIDSAPFNTYQYLGFYSLIFLAQAIHNHNITHDIHIDILSNNLQDVLGNENLRPEKATILGPCKIIPQEYPGITCRSIDIVVPETNLWQADRLLDQLITELGASVVDQIVAYREHYRWVQIFEPIPFTAINEQASKIRAGGVYLITGGFGGVGRVLARHLAQSAGVHLVLLSRSELPARHAWDLWLSTHQEHDEISEKIRFVQDLEVLGANVLAIRADVTDWDQMHAAKQQVKDRFGVIHGAIHAVGLNKGGTIQAKTTAMSDIYIPKVQGAIILSEVLRDIDLDFIILCSTIHTLLPFPGQVDFCAESAFLDTFARQIFSEKRNIISVDWDRWHGVGMSASIEEKHKILTGEELPWIGMLSHEAVDVFERVVRLTNLPQIIVSSRDVSALRSAANMTQRTAADPVKAIHSRPTLQDAYVAPRNTIEETIATIWQNCLGIDQIGVHDDYFALGGDSLMAIQVISHMRKTFDFNLPLRVLLEAPTIARLAEHIEMLWSAQSPQDIPEEEWEQGQL